MRRPLLALIALAVVLAIGYGYRAVHDDGSNHHAPAHSLTDWDRALSPARR